MKRSTTKAMLLLPLVLITLFAFAVQSEALVLADSTSTLDWSTFGYTLSPNMSLTWWDNGLSSNATSRIDVGSNVGAVYDPQSASGWTDVASSATYPGIYHESVIQGTTLYSFSEVNSSLYSGYERLHTQDTAQRTGYFTINGSGTVTFMINFSLDSYAQNSGPDKGYAGARAGLSLNNLTNGPGLDGWNGAEAYSYAISNLGESMSKSDSGTISVSVDFANGDTGSIIAQAFSWATYQPPAPPVPEPSMLSLLGCALAGLMVLKKNRS